MTGQNNLRGWNKIQELLRSESFLNDVRQLRESNDFIRSASYVAILDKHHIPTSYFRLIKNYIDNDEIDKTLIGEYVEIDTHNGVSLKLAFDTTQPMLKKYIDDNWKIIIKPQLDKISKGNGRIKATYDPENDKKIYEEYINRKQNKKSVTQIAIDFDTSDRQIRRIINRYGPDKK